MSRRMHEVTQTIQRLVWRRKAARGAATGPPGRRTSGYKHAAAGSGETGAGT